MHDKMGDILTVDAFQHLRSDDLFCWVALDGKPPVRIRNLETETCFV